MLCNSSYLFPPFFFNARLLMPVVFAAYETDVIEHSWSGGDTMREPHAVLQPASSLPSSYTKQPPYYTYAVNNLPIMQCIMAHLICGNGRSSDEGRDGGLCNHAVGGDAVRRGVEPEKGERGRR